MGPPRITVTIQKIEREEKRTLDDADSGIEIPVSPI